MSIETATNLSYVLVVLLVLAFIFFPYVYFHKKPLSKWKADQLDPVFKHLPNLYTKYKSRGSLSLYEYKKASDQAQEQILRNIKNHPGTNKP